MTSFNSFNYQNSSVKNHLRPVLRSNPGEYMCIILYKLQLIYDLK